MNQQEFKNVEVEQYANGQILLRSKMELKVCKAEKQDVAPYEQDRDRPDIIHVDGDVVGRKHKMEAEDVMGTEIQMRHPSIVESRATIYGKKQNVSMVCAHSSIFGLNREYLTSTGAISGVAVTQRLRELATNVETREQRIGRFFNAINSRGFYDNMVPLFIVILIDIYKNKFLRKNSRSTHLIRIRIDDVKVVLAAPMIQQRTLLQQVLSKGPCAVGCYAESVALIPILESMQHWVASARPEQTARADGTSTTDPDYLNQFYEKNVEVWNMYSYDDGHSKSGSHFGDHFGFVKNRFLVDTTCSVTDIGENAYTYPSKYEIPLNDMAIDNVNKEWGYLNCSGFVQDEIKMLHKYLYGNRRTTPFLIDQDIIFDIPTYGIKAYHAPEMMNDRAVNYTEEQATRLLSKLVLNHRAYEDLLIAQRYIEFWIAQPGAETVESHWWTNLDRTLSIPQLGLRRAVFPFLLEGEAVALSQQAMDNYTATSNNSDQAVIESAQCNTMWYWGEYMYVLNKNNTRAILAALHMKQEQMLDTFYRAKAMQSAVSGKALPSVPYSQTGTYLTGGIYSNFSKIIKFGHIDIHNISDYGYGVVGNDVHLNTIMQPGCVGLILGCSGSMVAGTPYSAIFAMSSAVTKNHFSKNIKAYNYIDMWAACVVSRWNGYDLTYKHPAHGGEHRSYAANGVSVAMPPVLPVNMTEVKSYEIVGVRPRHNCFGSDLLANYNNRIWFVWQRHRTEVALRDDYWSPPCPTQSTHLIAPTKFNFTTALASNYSAMVLASYDYNTSLFQVSDLAAGVALPENSA
uniref:Truncated coat protein n=1 Tax=Phakopsora pachyrhizi mycovirus TaxID=1750576 RepID=A0A0S2MYN0_9VIRU|nr:truncated coat protein [Phakopsora pachyrhizi mycovirus]